jgi:Heavy metal binding domain
VNEPSRGVRLATFARSALLGALALTVVASWAWPARGVRQVAASVFACPMHAEVTAASPGTCPVCRMALAAMVEAAPIARDERAPDGLVAITLSEASASEAGVTTAPVAAAAHAEVLAVPARVTARTGRGAMVTADLEGNVPFATGAQVTWRRADGAPPTRGRIARIDREEEMRAHLLHVRIELPDDASALAAAGVVELLLPGARELVVPTDAVVLTAAAAHVFVANDGHLQPRRIALGEPRPGGFAVAGGLTEGERVVTGGTFFVDAESRLRAARRR